MIEQKKKDLKYDDPEYEKFLQYLIDTFTGDKNMHLYQRIMFEKLLCDVVDEIYRKNRQAVSIYDMNTMKDRFRSRGMKIKTIYTDDFLISDNHKTYFNNPYSVDNKIKWNIEIPEVLDLLNLLIEYNLVYILEDKYYWALKCFGRSDMSWYMECYVDMHRKLDAMCEKDYMHCKLMNDNNQVNKELLTKSIKNFLSNNYTDYLENQFRYNESFKTSKKTYH